jgi:hypothetical protein
MCPDKQFLSVYFDGELPSPWKERMERHLETCSECRENLEIYRKMSRSLVAGGGEEEADAVVEAAASRVWARLESRKRSVRRGFRRFLPARVPQALSAAVAGAIAATVVICLMFLFTQGQNGNGEIPELTDAAGNFVNMVPGSYDLDTPDIIPASNVNDVLRYLEGDNSSDIVIIKLPERKRFNHYGEPAFINAADYSRRAKK